MKAAEVINDLRRRFPHEPEYLQAVEEVVTTIEDVYNQNPEFEQYNLIERLCIPDRIFSFRVSWVDDKGRVQNNMGYRIELGEIETALYSVEGLHDAVCFYDAMRDKIVCVYAGNLDTNTLAKALRTALPKYMLPNVYEKLEALPHNANGKLDRAALKERFLHAEG